MKPLLCVTLITVILALTGPCFGVERVLQEWAFTNATDTLGWTAAEPLDQFKAADGALLVKASTHAPKLESPLFDIEAAAWQYVEIDLKTDADGVAQMYYSNRTEGPYHGFSPDLFMQFYVEAGDDFHTYKVFPFWQKQGRITHIRIDPPGNNVAVRAVRIIGAKARTTTAPPLWQFKDSSANWQSVVPAGELKTTAAGWEISGTNRVIALSPPIDIDSDDHLWVTLRIASKTPHTVLFKWASPGSVGLQSAAIPLRDDETMHSYSLDLGTVSEWSGRIEAVGVTPTDSRESRTIVLESVALADAPVGPPELEIARLGLEDAFVRVGEKTKLVVEVRNVGGSDAKSVAALGLLRHEDDSEMLPAKRAGTVAAGKVARFEWEIDAEAEGTRTAVCRVNAVGLVGEQKSVYLTFHPKLDKSEIAGADYVPEPQPADTGDYLVGAYYFPGWYSYDRWAVLDNFPDRKPILGYYREGVPEIVDWQINWALSHGISYFIYDWYWNKGTRQLEHALHDAFLNSRYQDRFKFCLLWANHNPRGTSSEQDLMDVTKYWIENYFHHPNYLKLEGKNVMVIFSPNRLTEDMGADAVKAAFPKMRKMCEDAGVGGLYLVACTYPGPEKIKELQHEGYDALSGYNYPYANTKGQVRAPYQWMVEGYKDFWTQIADAATIPYIPVCEAGWDARPWHGHKSVVRTGKSPYLWETMLENAKAFVDDSNHKLPAGKKMVFLEAWNEYGEGDYIEPHAQYGFDYLAAVRNVFAPESKEPIIVVPKDVDMGPHEFAKPEPRTAWDFSKADHGNWHVGNMGNLSYDGGVIRAEAQGGDPAFYSPLINVDATTFKVIEIKMKMDKGREAQVFFTRPRGAMTEEKSVRFPVTGDNQFHVYDVDLSQNARWKGTIGQLRLDPNAAAGSIVEIAYITLKQM